jgi:hypothetical protein
MKVAGEEEFQNYDEEAISHYNISDCLDLFRKIQFKGLVKTRAQKRLLSALKARILTLVMPRDGYLSKAKGKTGSGDAEGKTLWETNLQNPTK